jgi:hypothetical protein
VSVADARLQLFTASRWDQLAHLDLVLGPAQTPWPLGPASGEQILELETNGELRSVRGLWASAPMLNGTQPAFLCVLFSPLSLQVSVFATRFLIAPADLARLAREHLHSKLNLSSSNGFLVRKALLFSYSGPVNPKLQRADVLGEGLTFLTLPEEPTELFAPGVSEQLWLSCRPRQR